MKMIWSVVFFLAILGMGFGQTTTFAPKSQCGIAALKCYTDQNTLLDNKFDAFDFAGSCQVFKTVITCMANLQDCSNDGDFRAVRQGCINDQYGICGVDGSILSCGVDVSVCFNEMETVLNDAEAKNFTAACPLINKFGVCVQNVATANECNQPLNTKLSQMQQMLESDKELGGCDGKCAEAIGFCTLNATDLPTGQAALNTNFTDYCRSALQVNTCLNSLQQNPVCASTSSPSGIDPSYYLQAVTQNEFAKIGDVCNTDGTPSRCVIDLIECVADLPGILATNDTSARCQIASDFLECISRLPCMTSLAPVVADLRNAMETDEIEYQCPSVGSCDDRLKKCSQATKQVPAITASNKDAVCPTIKTAIACFNFVENDPYCINEKNAYTDAEQALKIQCEQCGDARCSVPPTDSTGPANPCQQAVARCKNVPALPASQSILNWDVTTYCQTALTVYACFNNLTLNSTCSGSIGGINASEYLQTERENTFAKVGDVCNQDGSPSTCIYDLGVCSDALTEQSNVNDVSTRCQAMSSFLECTSSLPCWTTLAPLIDNYKETLENEETQKQCPSVGDCKERFILCGQQEQAIANSTQSNNDAACKKLRSCFEFVKNDPKCINEKDTFANEERDAENFISGQCGGGAPVLLPIKLMVASLLLVLMQCF